jgi:RNA polymerase primary sigma factor
VCLYTWSNQSTKLKRTSAKLSQELGRKPNEHGVILPLWTLASLKCKKSWQADREPVSMEMPLNRDDETYIGDLIEDSESTRPDATTAEELMRQDLGRMLSQLTPRERDIMHLRYGLEDGRQRTLEEVGRLFNITRERVRQIEHKAFRKLRQPNWSSRLAGYLDEELSRQLLIRSHNT